MPANTAIDIILSSSLADGTSFNKYGLFLFIEAPQNHPPHNQFLACYLAKSLPVSSLDVLTKVPDSVGPNDVYYRMAVLDYSGDPNLANYNCSFPYTEVLSIPFNFTGGTSTYSQFEIDGQYGARDFWNIPCSAYDCVRKCNQAEYPANQKNFPANFRTTYNCVADCPEVTYRDFDTYFGPCSSISSTAGSSSTQSAGDSSITTHTSTVTGSQTVFDMPMTRTTTSIPSTSHASEPSGSATSMTTSLSTSLKVNPKLCLAVTGVFCLILGGIMG